MRSLSLALEHVMNRGLPSEMVLNVVAPLCLVINFDEGNVKTVTL